MHAAINAKINSKVVPEKDIIVSSKLKQEIPTTVSLIAKRSTKHGTDILLDRSSKFDAKANNAILVVAGVCCLVTLMSE